MLIYPTYHPILKLNGEDIMLKLPCETIVKYVIPSLRGTIVRRLYRDYKMSQKEIARILGLSQPSISYYINLKRGDHLDLLDPYKEKINQIIILIVKSKKFPRDDILDIVCDICECVKKENCFEQLK
ncbi:MAG: winged helix-turn-helix transcriptional regulator [Candidatus Lokiarchaeota archaeon]|nr:winged helix-turn-helix transcriptional regulator [Candidatus Lokiarchaeota archaeon]